MSAAGRPPGILVTRPLPQAESTLAAFSYKGWRTFHFPTIDIRKNSALSAEQMHSRLQACDWLIFISQPAVHYFFAEISPQQVARLRIAAVGQATCAALHERGVRVDACPVETANSETLLQLDSLQQVKGRKIIIVRGRGGRELLKQALTDRHASVSYLEVYERLAASPDTEVIRRHWSTDITLAVCTSNQLLDNYRLLLEPVVGVAIYNKPVVVISPRMQAHAKQSGFLKIWLAEGPGNDQMIETIKTHLQLD